MTKFVLGEAVATELPAVLVEADLKPGPHRFSLVVVAADGRASAADEAIVQVAEIIPTVAVTPRSPRRTPT